MIGDIYKKTPISAYQPSKAVADLTAVAKRDFGIGIEILNKPWPELNDYSVIDRMNMDQRTFNAFVDESTEDEADSWKWQGTRSYARNKAMAMHAHLTSSYIIPEVSAQNQDNEEDDEMAEIMHDITEWMTLPSNSNYCSSFLMTTMGMLVNPVTYMGADYLEIYQEVKKWTEKGIQKEQVIDEVLSGFQSPVFSADQVLITNAYTQNIQKQRSIFKRRYIDYKEAEAQWGTHPNWQYVQLGIKSVYSEEDGLFYDVKDQDQYEHLVEEATQLNRRDDLQVCYINGIYMGDDNVDANPIKHRDHKDAPKYNVTPFGYNRINEHFFYYKSLMNCLNWDNNLLDAMYETTMNKALLELLMPVVITGEDEVDSDIVFPGSITAFANKDTKVSPLLPPSNPGAGYNAMALIEKSIDSGSVSPVESGQLAGKGNTAYSVAQAAQNAKTLLDGVMKNIGESITQYGGLMIDIALNHMTVADVEETAGMDTKLKYKAFILNDKNVQGKKTNKRILFDDSLMGNPMTKQQKDDYGVAMAQEVGWPNNKEHLYRVNPQLFSRMKYLTRVDPNTMFPKNQEYQQAMMNSLYTLLRQDPLIQPEALVRKLTYAYFRGEGEELMAKGNDIATQIMGGEQPTNGQQNGGATPKGPSSPAGNMADMKNLSTAMGGVG